MQKNKAKQTDCADEIKCESVPRKYYPNLEYNRSKKTKFITLSALLLVCMGLFIGAMVAAEQWWGLLIAVFLLLFIGALVPSVIKGYPTKQGVPELVVYGHDVTVRDKQMRSTDIEKVVVTVLLSPVSKLAEENKAFVKEFAAAFPEEPCFGTVDIYLKPGPKVKKGEVIYLTVEDCMAAAVDLVNAGVKHYSIFFSLKKIYEPARFSLTKKEKQTAKLSDVSEKDRRRQII